MPAADLSNSVSRARRIAESAAAAKAKEETAPEVIPVDTAFLCYRRQDTGQIVMTHDINTPIQVHRSPNHDDVYMMMQVILKDMTAAQIAALASEGVMLRQQAMVQSMMSPDEAAAMAQLVNRRPG